MNVHSQVAMATRAVAMALVTSYAKGLLVRRAEGANRRVVELVEAA